MGGPYESANGTSGWGASGTGGEELIFEIELGRIPTFRRFTGSGGRSGGCRLIVEVGLIPCFCGHSLAGGECTAVPGSRMRLDPQRRR